MRQANKPKFKRYIFAESTKETNIEEVPDIQSAEKETQGYIGYQHGYTEYNMKPLTEGGKPPRGQQLNQVLKDITSVTQYATVGGTYGIDTNVINSSGYPKNAIICVDDVGLFRSLRDDNKESNYDDTSSWKKVVDFNPKFYQQRILGEVFFANRLDNPDGCLQCDGREYKISDYPRLQKYIANGKVGYTSYNEYKSMVDNTGSCILFAWDKGDKFRAPTLKCGTMLSNPYGQIDAYNNGGSIIPKIGESLYDQVLNIQGYVGPIYADVGLGYKVGLKDTFVSNGVFAPTTTNSAINNSKQHLGLANSAYKFNKIVKIVFDASKMCATGSQVLPRTAHLNAFVVVNDYFITTLDFKRDDSNDPITSGDGVWEMVEQYDFTDKNELEFTYNNNERYKLFLSNLTVNTESPCYLRANVSNNGSEYITKRYNNTLSITRGYENYEYVYGQNNKDFMIIGTFQRDEPRYAINKGSLASLEIDIIKGFNNNKKQFNNKFILSKDNFVVVSNCTTDVYSESFGNTGKIKIKVETSSDRLSGNASLYKIN